MRCVIRREQLRRQIRSEASTADRLCEAVTDSGLRKRISAASINLAAVEEFFLNTAGLPAHQGLAWLDVAEHWLAVHTSVLRGLEFELTPSIATVCQLQRAGTRLSERYAVAAFTL